jgi:hypothetical protein
VSFALKATSEASHPSREPRKSAETLAGRGPSLSWG